MFFIAPRKSKFIIVNDPISKELKQLKELTVVLLSLLIVTVTLNVTLRADATSNDILSEEKTWAYSPYDLENFTIIVLPDTQYYSESYPEVFDNQTQWIVNNIESLNIVFVTHLGDVVDNWDNIYQWENANRSMSTLDGYVPWGILAGNHDGINSEQTNFEKYFGSNRFSNESWYGGAYHDNNKNNYQLFSAGGDDYLILHLQYDPSDDIMAWAGGIIDDYPNRRVIVSVHEYLGWRWEGLRSSIGERIWQKLVKPHADQIFLVLCGHVDVVDRRTELVDGHAVHELIFDYQEQSKGGNGWLKILECSPLQDKIFVKTYSPYLGKFNHDSNSEYTLDYDMTSAQTSISVLSNSTLSDFAFDQLRNQINFKLSGENGTTGYCNVTIPDDLILGNPWSVQSDEILQAYNYYRNATHTSLYFKYIHSSILQVTITGTETIPEFEPVLVLPMFVITTLFIIIIYRRKLNLQTNKVSCFAA